MSCGQAEPISFREVFQKLCSGFRGHIICGAARVPNTNLTIPYLDHYGTFSPSTFNRFWVVRSFCKNFFLCHNPYKFSITWKLFSHHSRLRLTPGFPQGSPGYQLVFRLNLLTGKVAPNHTNGGNLNSGLTPFENKCFKVERRIERGRCNMTLMLPRISSINSWSVATQNASLATEVTPNVTR